MRKKSIISICLATSILMISGCDAAEDTSTTAGIELIEPKGAEVGIMTEPLVRRNIYVSATYDAYVYPKTTEYFFDASQVFATHEVSLGDSVRVGQVLTYADDEALTEKVENFQERMDKLKEDYEEFLKEAREDLSEAQDAVEYYAEILENMEETEPENKQSKEYSKWSQELHKWNGEYSIQEFYVATGEEEMRQRKELYDLDYAYNNGQLQELLALSRGTKITANEGGVVVGMKFMEPEANIQQESPVIAVADMGEKYIKCECIPRRDVIYYSKDVYAFINGKRYEVTYVDDESKECSTFMLHDENNEVTVGDYAKLVLIKTNSREQVLAVANEALYTDASGRYVYVVKDGEPVATHVKVGVSDDVYTEILSGVDEGALIQMQTPSVASNNIYEVEKSDFVKSFSRAGVLYYPGGVNVRNEVENGTTYFVEYLVNAYQYVNEGDPIATIRVEGDKLKLAQMEIDLKRDKERLNDLIAEDNEANAETIELRRESIAEQEESLADLRKDYSTTTIYATASGYVEKLTRYSVDDKVKTNEIMAVISCVDEGYLVVDDTLGILSYGDVLDVSYTDKNKNVFEMQGVVVNLNNYGVSSSLEQESVLLKLPEENMQALLESMKTERTRYTYNKLKMSGTVQEMNNVLLVPVDAVTEKDGITYVNVMLDDGTVVPMSFLAGGSDADYYWVVDGLTEGMKLCWE